MALTSAAHATLPIGTFTDTGSATCPAGSLGGAVCRSFTLSGCPGTSSLNGQIRVAIPGSPNGTIVIHGQAGGTTYLPGSWDNYFVNTAGFRTIDVKWATNWEDTGTGNPGSILLAACRPATVFNYVFTHYHASDRTTGICGMGVSAGAAAQAYGLAHFATGSFFDYVQADSGPALDDIHLGCFDNGSTTETVCPGFPGTANYPPGATFTNQISHTTTCQNSPVLGSPDDIIWTDESLLSAVVDTPLLNYAQTPVGGFYCPDFNEAAGQGAIWLNAITSTITGLTCRNGCGNEDYWLQSGTLVPANLLAMEQDVVTNCVPRHAAATPTPTATPTAAPTPSVAINGTYATIGYNSGWTIQSGVLTQPALDGVVIYVPWNVIETSDNTFTYTALDAVISQATTAGKKFALALLAGARAPSYLSGAGAQMFNFIAPNNNFAPTFPATCSSISAPVIWDSVYQNRWARFVGNLGTRYGSNPALAYVHISAGLGAFDDEASLPSYDNNNASTTTFTCTGASCVAICGSNPCTCNPNDDTTNWQAVAGPDGPYTRVLMFNAWSQAVVAAQTAFPTTYLATVIVPNTPGVSFPPLDDTGARILPTATTNVDAHQPNNGTHAIINALTAPANETVQNDGWNTGFVSPVVIALQGTYKTGYQTSGALGCSGLTTATNLLTTDGATPNYVELYQPDVSGCTSQLQVLHDLVFGIVEPMVNPVVH